MQRVKFFTWYILLSKRLLKKVGFLAMLITLLILTLGIKFFSSREESSVLKIGLYIDKDFNKNIEEISLIPPVNGEVKDVSQSSDQTFASKAMGDGILVNPIDEVFVAPADAKVELVFPTKHAIGLTLKDGSQILIHCGINTVTMNGEGFETYVEEGQEVKQGDKLVKMDLKKVQEAGHSTQTLIIVNEVGQGSKVIVDANSKTPIIIKKA